MKEYDDLFLRVDFGSDGPDPIWRAGRRRCSPESSSVAALRRGWPNSAFPGSKRATSGLGGDYATRVVLLGLLRASGRLVVGRAASAAALRGGASPARSRWATLGLGSGSVGSACVRKANAGQGKAR